ncbi:MAG: PilT/PilU family type 4a pilus ATPase [Hydrogenibacillus schlegelii]|nr:PilT/PilU family type 4a pilus ATPase [Hydrogenibacillus schlegelii]
MAAFRRGAEDIRRESGKGPRPLGENRVSGYLSLGARRKASDVHLAAGEPPAIRLDGALLVLPEPPLTAAELWAFIEEALDSSGLARLQKEGSIDAPYGIEGVATFRLNIFKQKGVPALAARIIPDRVPTVEELGLPEAVRSLARLEDGLVLVTGPTGSGKSTTLAAIIETINREAARHIITLEDPIEYVFENRRSLIRQREIGRDAASFAAALRAALRQDPDVILVGEMRDLETIATAITAAETGHLVLSTLHTKNAAQTIDRIIDVFPAAQQNQVRQQLSATLRAVVSQRLLPRRGRGRVALAEILINTPAVANLIRQQKTHQIPSLMQTGTAYGMQTFERAARRLIEAGAVDPAHLRPYLAPAGADEA